jgi:hypothetical protein
MQIKTASWFTKLPAGHARIGISRSVPHRLKPGYRIYRKLAPGPWFSHVAGEEFYHRWPRPSVTRFPSLASRRGRSSIIRWPGKLPVCSRSDRAVTGLAGRFQPIHTDIGTDKWAWRLGVDLDLLSVPVRANTVP